MKMKEKETKKEGEEWWNKNNNICESGWTCACAGRWMQPYI